MRPILLLSLIALTACSSGPVDPETRRQQEILKEQARDQFGDNSVFEKERERVERRIR